MSATNSPSQRGGVHIGGEVRRPARWENADAGFSGTTLCHSRLSVALRLVDSTTFALLVICPYAPKIDCPREAAGRGSLGAGSSARKRFAPTFKALRPGPCELAETNSFFFRCAPPLRAGNSTSRKKNEPAG